MTYPSVDAGEEFRRKELVWSLNRLASLVNANRLPLPHRMIGPPVIEFRVPPEGVNQAAQVIGRTPERYRNEYFVALDGEELRVRWSAHVAAEPTGLDFSREPDDPTPVSPARVPMHTGGMTEGGLIDETTTIEVADGRVVHECCGKLDDTPHRNFCLHWTPYDGPVCQGAPTGFEAGCGTAGPHGPHAIEAV